MSAPRSWKPDERTLRMNGNSDTVTLDNLTAEEDPPTRKVPHITMMVKAMNLVAIGPSARRD